MSLLKKLEYLFFPCQRKIDAMIEDHDRACQQLSTVVTKYPQFAHVQGRRHVNPR